MPRHSDIIGADAVHPIAYYQSGDPGAVGAGKHWYDTTDALDLKLKVRNTNNNGWEVMYGTGRGHNILIGNGLSALNTGVRIAFHAPHDGEFLKWRLVAPWDASPSAVVDIWRDTYANYPPTIADTICASEKPTLTTARKAESTTLTGWTKGFTEGDLFHVNLDSASNCTGLLLTLIFKRV